MIFKPKLIIVHHSATRDSGTVSWGAIRKWHTMHHRWSDIGYHAGIEIVRDSSFECLYGRPEHLPGSHTKGKNRESLGICFVGNYDVVEPPLEMLEIAAQRVIVPWMLKYDIPVIAVQAHRTYADKTCPGKLFGMERLRNAIRSLI